MIDVVPLEQERRSILRFLRVPFNVYRKDPYWVAPLMYDAAKVLSRQNPLFQHAEIRLWVASRNGTDVGRIAALVDYNYIHFQNDEAGFFGFFECINDPEASTALFEAALEWVRQRKVKRVIGPMNPTTNDECGLLIHGFNSSPTFMMPYNPPYYADLVEGAGFTKAKDLVAYIVSLPDLPTDKLNRVAEKARRRNPDLTVRPVTRKTLERDIDLIKEVYNAAWQKNWGFVPMTDAEIDFMAARLKPLLVEGLVWIVESPREPVAFLLAVPDFNQTIKPLNGRLLSPKAVRILPNLLGWRFPKVCRVVTLGVKEGYRNRGLESLMLAEGLKVGTKIGFTAAEASWVLEDNIRMLRVIEVFNGKHYKTYRIYERAL
ncbi:MAG: N-acetyltransferase [Verrucomicrobiae bacterium]|nr:N-acetyltransferase [Verrucomicrobiae bacterium]